MCYPQGEAPVGKREKAVNWRTDWLSLLAFLSSLLSFFVFFSFFLRVQFLEKIGQGTRRNLLSRGQLSQEERVSEGFRLSLLQTTARFSLGVVPHGEKVVWVAGDFFTRKGAEDGG